MKLSNWAKSKGITYKTAHRMFKAGRLPVEVEQLPTGTILDITTVSSTGSNACEDGKVADFGQWPSMKQEADTKQACVLFG